MNRTTALIILAALAAASIIATAALWLAGGSGTIEQLFAELGLWVEAKPVTAIVCFALWAIAANLVVIPSGSLTLVAAGFLAGPWVPALIWWGSQVMTAPIVHTVGRRSFEPGALERWLAKAMPAATIETLQTAAQKEAFLTSVIFRLMPTLPSAPAAILASLVGIRVATFTAATVAVGWLRPLYFASLGASLPALRNPSGLLDVATLAPLIAVFVAMAAMLGLRLWLARRAQSKSSS